MSCLLAWAATMAGGALIVVAAKSPGVFGPLALPIAYAALGGFCFLAALALGFAVWPALIASSLGALTVACVIEWMRRQA